MRKRVKEAIGETLQDLVDVGVKVKFTKKELNDLGVKMPDIKMSPERIQKVRKRLKISQAVFADLLNVSLSSIRQWEIGVRHPSGSTRVLLELLERDPKALDFRLKKKKAA